MFVVLLRLIFRFNKLVFFKLYTVSFGFCLWRNKMYLEKACFQVIYIAEEVTHIFSGNSEDEGTDRKNENVSIRAAVVPKPLQILKGNEKRSQGTNCNTDTREID